MCESSQKKQSSVSNKSVIPSSFFWMHLRGSIRLGASNGRPKRWRGNHLRYEGRRELGKPHRLPQVDQVALFFYQICPRDLCCFVVLPGLISEDDGTKAPKKIKKINETPFYSPLESSFFAFFPSSPAWVARAQMDDVRTTISDSISLPALPRVHLASTPPPQQSSSSKEVDIKKHHGGLILQNESTM